MGRSDCVSWITAFIVFYASIQVVLCGVDSDVGYTCRSFFILDFPNEYMNAWPTPDQVVTQRPRHTLDYQHVQGTNFGAGRVSNAKRGIYETSNPDHMYQTIMARLRVHPQRTLNRSEACLLIIPLDLGIFSWYNKSTGYYRFDFLRGCEGMEHVEGLLTSEVEQAPLWGHEMLYISSSLGFFSRKCLIIMKSCVNCTRLTYFPEMTKKGFYALNMRRVLHLNTTYRDFGIPPTSSVHLTEDMTDYPWVVTPKNLFTRDTLVSIWASPNVQRKFATKIREALLRNCNKYPGICLNAVILHRYNPLSYNVTLNVENLYGRSVFCLNPPGDNDVRKGIFDSILMGCIPVLFTPNLLSYRYEWYFTIETEQSCALFLTDPNSAVEQLLTISNETILEKQRCIERIAPTLAFGLPPSRLSPYIGFGGGKTSLDTDKIKWQPPNVDSDAVDIILKNMYRRIRRFHDTFEVPENEKPGYYNN